VLETGEPVRGRTVRIDPEDGEGRWLSVHAAPLGDGDGPGAVVALADVTERRERRRDLERTTELYETTLANIRDTVLITDDEGRFTYVCPNVSHIFGYDPGTVRDLGTVDALLGEDLFDPADLERTGELRNLETTVTDSEGRDRVVLVTAKRVAIEEGTVLYSVREITERKERERRFEAIFDRTFQFMGLLEPDGTVVEINETALAFAGVDREAVVGRPAWETDWWRVDRPTRRRLRDAVGRAGDGEFVRFDAEIEGCESTATVDCSIRPITDDEEVVLLVAEGRDITDHKRQERELERQNERLEEFASVVSHDLRNPLTVAQGSLELAREEGAPAHFDRVESAHDRMHALIEDLLTVAREGQRVEETSPVALDSLVESTWAGVPSGDATLEVAFESYRLEADEARLRQLLENLLSNAVEYGGEDVTVRVGLLDEDGFYVADDGPGIPPLQRETVFDHGFSTGEAGTGFGLSIVEGIAEAHGWSVAATGSADGGARFEVIVDRPGQSSAREDRPPG
jgi:PAS domain S-box-containing protein